MTRSAWTRTQGGPYWERHGVTGTSRLSSQKEGLGGGREDVGRSLLDTWSDGKKRLQNKKSIICLKFVSVFLFLYYVFSKEKVVGGRPW